MRRVIWTATLFLVLIGLLAVARRSYVLLSPPKEAPRTSGMDLDAKFTPHRTLTLVHILPAGLFMILMPLQFMRRIRRRWLVWHRWSGRLLVLLGAIIGISALVMSYTSSIGGANETAATTLFAILFLVFLGLGFWNIRKRRIVQHREWMIRAFAVGLGVATTRPIVGAFFAARRLTPQEFFGIAFWLGFTTTLIAAEAYVQYSRSRPGPRLQTL